jgi:exosortase A-associated hydrolase 2
VVFCHPFAEEKKCSHRAYVHLARRLSIEGYAALRFDFSGCGDSEGEFVAATLEAWEADAAAAAAFLRAETGAIKLTFFGLRLGAVLALRACGNDGAPAALVLWQPVVNGKDYVAENFRRVAIKQMLTQGQGRAPGGEAVEKLRAGEGEMDFDGYRLCGALYCGLSEIVLATPAPRVPTLLVQVAPRDVLQREYRSLVETWQAAGARVSARAVIVPPIWSRLELEDPAPLIEATVEWLRELEPPRAGEV